MTTPESTLTLLLPVTYTGEFTTSSGNASFTVDGKPGQSRVPCPFTGQVMVQIISGAKSSFLGYAHGGGYSYSALADATGRENNWRCTYNIAVRPGQEVTAYPNISTRNADQANVGAPVAITFVPVGEHKT